MHLFDCCEGDLLPPGRADARRGKLIAAARTLFAEHGFHSTGMAQIAAASGIKVGQIYRDFPSKEAIVAAIVEADLTGFLDGVALREAVAGRDLAVVQRWIVDFVCEQSDRMRGQLIPEICAESARNERIAAIMETVQRRVLGDLTLALAAFAPEPAKAGEVAVLADLILTLAIGLTSQQTTAQRDLAPLCTRIEALLDAELAALAS